MLIVNPFEQFFGLDGEALENGYVSVGAAGSDPDTSPITVYADAAMTVTVAQPIRTTNGSPRSGGTPIRLYVNATDYSIRVRDDQGQLVFYRASSAPVDLLELYAAAIVSAASAGIYASTAAGIAGTTNGKYFLVVGSGDIFATLYKNVAGVATAQNVTIPSNAALASITPLLDSIVTDEDDVTNEAHALSIKDSDGRIEFAIGGDGVLVDSPAFVGSLLEAAGLNNTSASIDRLARHGLTFANTDWWGVFIAGQSNAGGASTAITTTQPFSNKRRSGGTLIALVESSVESVATSSTSHAKDRLLKVLPPWGTFPQDWIATNMSNVSVFTGLNQGTTPYNNGLAAVTSIKAQAVAAGKSYAERALMFIHGESDSNAGTTQAAYLALLLAYKNNWNTDVLAITGQADRIPLFIAPPGIGDAFTTTTGPTLAMLEAAEIDDEIFVIAPGYAFRFVNDGLHYTAHDERRLGEYFGKALHRYYIDRRDPSTVRPIAWTLIDARTIEVEFYVPVPPLVFDLDQVWPPDAGLGFAVYDSGGSGIAIAGVRLTGPATVRITISADVTTTDRITYATKIFSHSTTGGIGAGNHRGARGCLRDSDMTPSYYTDAFGELYPLHNWCAAFSKTL